MDDMQEIKAKMFFYHTFAKKKQGATQH